jgi:hypothetical protein
MKPANCLHRFILILFVCAASGCRGCEQPNLKVDQETEPESRKQAPENPSGDLPPRGDKSDEQEGKDDNNEVDSPENQGDTEEDTKPEENPGPNKDEKEKNEPNEDPKGKEPDQNPQHPSGESQTPPSDYQPNPQVKNQRRTKTVVAGEIINLLGGLAKKSTAEGKKFLGKLDQQLKTTQSSTSNFPFGSLEDLKTDKSEELKSSSQYIQGLLQSTLKNAQLAWEEELKGTVNFKNRNDISSALSSIYQKIEELKLGNLPEN